MITSPPREFHPFTSWAELIDHVRAGYPLWYQAPMDTRPHQVMAVIRKDGQLRVAVTYHNGVDPFTADIGHLPRFRKVK